MYKMNVTYNAADTSRDPDDIVLVCEKFYQTKEELLKGVKEYIQEHFYKKELAEEAKLDNIEDFAIMDWCSWGHVISVTKINMED